ncbi:hypothetical protein D770_02920 [Flammeovirgaceae bacterium 311]|nr:hypothetical protein D770_02920 [Flammeovirgaceae bacterium 311]
MPNPLAWFRSKINLKRLYFQIFSSIAFYPAIISLAMVTLGFLILYLDSKGVTYAITGYIPLIITDDVETARTLLSTLIGSIVSLMVFSFSMVMVVLTLASNNYTPRVLPELVNNRSHQVVLGIYLGTIGFLIVVLINLATENYDFTIPELAVLMSIILVFICFVSFVYFIHSISQNIQIANILSGIYLETQKALARERKHQFVDSLPGLSGWQTVPSPKGAYFQGVSDKNLLQFACDQDLQIVVMKEVGSFTVKGDPLMKLSKPVSDLQISELQNHTSFYHQEHIETNYLYGFKHITEVAVKAMSPGINDPGTALNAIDYLTQLFCDLIGSTKFKVIHDDQGFNRLFYKEASFAQVFYLCFSSIRNYAAGDVAVQLKLIEMLNKLESRDRTGRYHELFQQERMALTINAASKLENKSDREKLENGLEE